MSSAGPPNDGNSKPALTEPESPFRMEIAASLEWHAPLVGRLYRRGRPDNGIAGLSSRAAFHRSCCSRIVNRLPEALAVSGLAHVEYANPCDRIREGWRQAGLFLGAGKVVEIEGIASAGTLRGWHRKLSGFEAFGFCSELSPLCPLAARTV